MDQMEKLAGDVKRLEDQLAVCTSCGMCQANCPVFRRTRKETDVSRGKLALLKGLIRQMFDDAEGVSRHLDKCLLCGSCQHGCPSRVDTVEIFLKGRSIITQYLGLSYKDRIVFKKLVSSPERFNRIVNFLVPFQKIFFKRDRNLLGTSCARDLSPLFRGRHLVLLNDRAFNRFLSGPGYSVEGKGVRLVFFTGCLIDKVFPNIARSTLDVLRYFDAQVFVPSHQGCCGIPFLASGDIGTFEALVEYHVDLFLERKFDYLVTACATCASTIMKLWPALLKDRNRKLWQKAKKVSEKTADISWLMEKEFDIYGQKGRKDTGKGIITYHDPCHLKKTLGIYKEPREIILASGNDLREMKECDSCCGMGGTFSLRYYGISSEIGRKKAGNIIDTGCSSIATSCPACMIHISDMLAGYDSDIRVRHPVEIFAEKLAGRKKKEIHP